MAATQYRSAVVTTRANVRAVFAGVVDLLYHLDVWDLDLIQITRPTTGVNTGYIVVTTSDPMPADQIAHLRLVGPI